MKEKSWKIVFGYDPYTKNKQYYENIDRIERTQKGFRLWDNKGFYKDFHRFCLFWEVGKGEDPHNPCSDCLFNELNLYSCSDSKSKYNLSDNTGTVCCYYLQKEKKDESKL